jgi:relaxase-like protein
MNLKGNIRGSGTECAIHLTNEKDNEVVEVTELRGFAGTDLMDALQEVMALSRLTRCKKYLYSLSINPPKNVNASSEQFEDAIERAEKTLGLQGQPRCVVRHIKHSRLHYHVVWSRIDAKNMKAIKLNYPKRKLNGLAFDLFIDNGWEIPAGFLPGQEADPMNYSYSEYQEAKRGGREPKHLKHQIKTAWANADNRQSFEAALEQSGLFAAQGDRRGYVAVDYNGKTYSLSRWTGAKTNELADKLGEPEEFRNVEETLAMVAQRMTPKLQFYVAEVMTAAKTDLNDFEAQKNEMSTRHKQERQDLKTQHDERWQMETAERANRFSKGLRGIWDRVTGKYGQIVEGNHQETERGLQRDMFEQQELTDRQQCSRVQLQEHVDNARGSYTAKVDELYAQLAEYAAMGAEPEAKTEQAQQHRDAHTFINSASKFDLEQ